MMWHRCVFSHESSWLEIEARIASREIRKHRRDKRIKDPRILGFGVCRNLSRTNTLTRLAKGYLEICCLVFKKSSYLHHSIVNNFVSRPPDQLSYNCTQQLRLTQKLLVFHFLGGQPSAPRPGNVPTVAKILFFQKFSFLFIFFAQVFICCCF